MSLGEKINTLSNRLLNDGNMSGGWMVAVENSVVKNRMIVVISRLVGQTGPGTQSVGFSGPSRKEGLDRGSG